MDKMFVRWFGTDTAYNLQLKAIDDREVLSVKMSDDTLTDMTVPEMYTKRYEPVYPTGYFLEQA